MVETREAASLASPVIPVKVKFSSSVPLLPSLGAILRAKRLEMNLTLVQLAGRIGVHPMTVRYWETGEVTPRFKNREKLTNSLDEDLYGQGR